MFWVSFGTAGPSEPGGGDSAAGGDGLGVIVHV